MANDPNWLSDFSDMLARQSEENRRQQAVKVQTMKDGLEEQKRVIESYTPEQLVDYFRDIPHYCQDPREMEVWELVIAHTRAEILKRMA